MFLGIKGEALDQLEATIRAHPQWQWEIDRRHCFTKVAEGVLDLLGRTRADVLGEPIYAFMEPSEAVRVARFFRRRPGSFSCAISRQLRADGSTVAVESGAIPLQDEHGQSRGYLGMSHRITELDLSDSGSIHRMMAIYNTAPSALCLIGRDGRYLAVNATYAAVHGVSEDALVGTKVAERLPAAGKMIRRTLRMMDNGVGVPAQELEYSGRYYQVLANPVRNLMGQVIGITAALTDISDRKQAEQRLAEINRQLEYFAKSDHLTGLSNRRHVDEVLADEVQRAMRSEQPLSVLMLDVDFFKKYNDCYGHLRGDECLRTVAAELRNCLQRYCDVVGRYGGEEFVAILPGTDAAGALQVADTIIHAIGALNLPHTASRYGKVTVSVGVATLDKLLHPESIEQACDALLQAADRALYAAKLAGRNTSYGMVTSELPSDWQQD